MDVGRIIPRRCAPFFVLKPHEEMSMPWEFVGVKMPLELREHLEGLATRDESSMSAVIRRLIAREATKPLVHDDEVANGHN
jgi:hypothetical protein